MPIRGQQDEDYKVVKKQKVSKVEPKEVREVKVDEGKASVSYTISITKNLGDYESLKIQAGITIPYGASDELLKELDELLIVSREKVVSRLSKDIDDVTTNLT
jgi:hypothetical protein